MQLSQWFFAHALAIVGYLFAILLIPRILLERRHPGATIAWVLAIGLVPFLGVPLYFLIGGRKIKEIRHQKDWQRDLDCDVTNKDVLDIFPVDTRRIARLMAEASAFSPTVKNTIRLIDNGIEAYKTLYSMIERADRSIEVATFILGRDEVGQSLVQLLSEKAREGVQVRLLLDALGSMRTSKRFVDPIREFGGKVGIFLPILPVRRRWSANLRNHRKMTIVDGNQAFVGGMNLAREYMGPKPYKSRWKDVSMVIKGTAASHVRRVFWKDWIFSTKETVNPAFAYTCPDLSRDTSENRILQIVGDGPDLSERPLYSGVLAALNRAKERIWVVTPYFVPDDALSESLSLAARMKLDVRLILPEKSNHPLVDLAGRSYIGELIRAGVRLYFYQPGMLHAKLFAIDQRLAVVGSANMDIRSFQLNFEIASFLYDVEGVEGVTAIIQAMIEESRIVTVDEIRGKSRLRAFSEDICRVFSPLL